MQDTAHASGEWIRRDRICAHGAVATTARARLGWNAGAWLRRPSAPDRHMKIALACADRRPSLYARIDRSCQARRQAHRRGRAASIPYTHSPRKKPPKGEQQPRVHQNGSARRHKAGDRLSNEPIDLSRVRKAQPRSDLPAGRQARERFPSHDFGSRSIQRERRAFLRLTAGAFVDREDQRGVRRCRQTKADAPPAGDLPFRASPQRVNPFRWSPRAAAAWTVAVRPTRRSSVLSLGGTTCTPGGRRGTLAGRRRFPDDPVDHVGGPWVGDHQRSPERSRRAESPTRIRSRCAS